MSPRSTESHFPDRPTRHTRIQRLGVIELNAPIIFSHRVRTSRANSDSIHRIFFPSSFWNDTVPVSDSCAGFSFDPMTQDCGFKKLQATGKQQTAVDMSASAMMECHLLPLGNSTYDAETGPPFSEHDGYACGGEYLAVLTNTSQYTTFAPPQLHGLQAPAADLNLCKKACYLGSRHVGVAEGAACRGFTFNWTSHTCHWRTGRVMESTLGHTGPG